MTEKFDHEAIFEQAWNAPGTTSVDLPQVRVNDVLRDRYDVRPPFPYTGTRLWDMEVRKAAAPDKYIPTVVRPGSVEKFNSVRHGELEDFTRVSDQRLWAHLDHYTTVIEHVRLDHENPERLLICSGFVQALSLFRLQASGPDHIPVRVKPRLALPS